MKTCGVVIVKINFNFDRVGISQSGTRKKRLRKKIVTSILLVPYLFLYIGVFFDFFFLAREIILSVHSFFQVL